jgi:hypothetical protein
MCDVYRVRLSDAGIKGSWKGANVRGVEGVREMEELKERK